jgi:hypothetical protein
MNWREHSWEFVVGTLSWIVALVALAGIAIFVVVDTGKRRWAQRFARKISRPSVADLVGAEEMELAS